MKNTTFKKVILPTVVSVGLATPLIASNTKIIPFGQTAIVEAAVKKITLKHNAYLYNYSGHRIGTHKLYRHESYRYYSVKYIYGKKYYRIGKNCYIKASNAAKMHSNKVKKGTNTTSITDSSSTTKINTTGMGTPKFQVKIDNNNIDIYGASHATAHGNWITSIPLHGTFNVYAEENDMYEIGKDQWVNEDDTGEVVQSTNNTSDSDNISKADINNNSVSNTKDQETKPTVNSNKDENTIVGNLTESQRQLVIRDFVQLINQARQENGANPLILDSNFSSESQQRAIHDGTTLINTGDEDDHHDENGNSLLPNDAGGEVETGIIVYYNDTAKDLAKFAYNQFMVNDASQGWAHKKNLLNPGWTSIGVGVYFANGTDNFGSLVADLK